MSFYPERDNSKAAFAAGLGIGIAVAAAGAYAWKKFKETHPNFSLKEYCEKCGVLSDECDWDCSDNCDSCVCTEPQYEPECDIEDVEVDLTDSDDEESSAEDEEDGGRNLTGSPLISFENAKDKVLELAKKLYGNDTEINSEGNADNILLSNDGKTRKCYMFWIASSGDDVTPLAVFYVDIITGEVFDNSEKGMNKISD